MKGYLSGFFPKTALMPGMALTAASVAVLTAVALTAAVPTAQASNERQAAGGALSHIHDIATRPGDAGRLYVATHQGLYRLGRDGKPAKVGTSGDDFMSFTPDPSNPEVFFAGGHPATGGYLDMIRSSDAGTSWKKVSRDGTGPFDFHAIEISAADPKVVYGLSRGLQVSRDGGANWSVGGSLPERTYDIAASSRNSDTIYAAAQGGLSFSRDGGASWSPAYLLRRPATMVKAEADGTLYAYIQGVGLLKTTEPSFAWRKISDFGKDVVLDLAVDPANPNVLFVNVASGRILTSSDGGRTWGPLNGASTAG